LDETQKVNQSLQTRITTINESHITHKKKETTPIPKQDHEQSDKPDNVPIPVKEKKTRVKSDKSTLFPSL